MYDLAPGLSRRASAQLLRILLAGGIRGAQVDDGIEDLKTSDATAITGKGPIGVPEGYSVAKYRSGGGLFSGGNPFGPRREKLSEPFYQQQPRYKFGDEFNLPGGMNPNNIAMIQDLMLDAGLIASSTDWSRGGWNQELATIWRDNVLGPANQRGMTAIGYLRDLISRGGQFRLSDLGESNKKPYQLPVRQVKNADDLRSTFKMTASKVLGRNISDEEANSMVMAYRSVEIAREDQLNNVEYQQALASSQGAEGQGAPITIEGAPDPEGYAERIFRERYGGEAAAYDLRKVLPDLGQMLSRNPFKQG